MLIDAQVVSSQMVTIHFDGNQFELKWNKIIDPSLIS